eukprot:Skav225239  [mRNA]  locus=scaffold2946:255843:256598:+ [translate_table: standard]
MDGAFMRWWKLARSSAGLKDKKVKELHFRYFVTSVDENPESFAHFVERLRRDRFGEEGKEMHLEEIEGKKNRNAENAKGERGKDSLPVTAAPSDFAEEDSYCEAERSVRATKRCNTLTNPFVCATKEDQQTFRYMVSL